MKVRLSTRTKEAIKTGLAMAIAYGIALQMGWEKPLWAGFAVAMISLSTAGQSLNKGVMRMLGTLVAALAALAFLALFAQDRWALVGILSLYVGLCTYMLTGEKWQYAWFVSAFVCLVIVVNAGTTSEGAFYIAVARVKETGMGILVYALVSLFLWPRSTRGELEKATGELFATQIGLYRNYRALMSGQGRAEDSRPLRLREIRLLARVGQALTGAATDSYEVWEVRRQWRRFLADSTEFMEALERWRASFPELQLLDLPKLLPDLDALCSEIDRRLTGIEGMLAGKPRERMPQTIPLAIDEAELSSLSHFEQAAVLVTATELERLEVLSRSLFGSVADIRGYARQGTESDRKAARGSPLAVDPDRVIAAVRIMATLWIAFLIWIYVDPPGHEAFVQLTVTFAMIAVMMRAPPSSMLLPFASGSVVAGVLYVFVMPRLSGYWELGLLIFGFTFAVYYLFSEPRQTLAKFGAIVPFIVLTFIEDQQGYDFARYANTTAQIMLGILLVIATAYLPPSPRPEKTFLRLLRRFFGHSAFLMSRIAPDWKAKRGPMARFTTALYGNDLLELPAKLAVWGGKIDHRAFPDNTPEQVQALVTALHALALRMKALVDAAEHPQAELLVRELSDDIRAWRLLVQKQFGLWADDPEAEVEPGVDARERLKARLARLEARMEEVFKRVGEGALISADYENCYRLLGSHRGLSESGLDYLRLAEQINWAQWQKARF